MYGIVLMTAYNMVTKSYDKLMDLTLYFDSMKKMETKCLDVLRTYKLKNSKIG